MVFHSFAFPFLGCVSTFLFFVDYSELFVLVFVFFVNLEPKITEKQWFEIRWKMKQYIYIALMNKKIGHVVYWTDYYLQPL